jgi:predicted dehydrogenase
VRVGIVGCGSVLSAHLDALNRLGLEVVAVCDRDDERSARAASAAGTARAYRDAEELIERERPDVVHVLTPPQFHADTAVRALEAGCNVLVEKPMALNLAEADRMLEAARRSGQSLGVCHNLLFDPATLHARELARSGRLGRVVAAEHVFAISGKASERYRESSWIRELPGGPVHELAPHFVYLQREFLGELTVVSAVGWEDLQGGPSPLEFRALFEGQSGFGSAAVSLSARPLHTAVRLYGTKMTLHIDPRGHVLASARRDVVGGNAQKTLANVDFGAQLIKRTVGATLSGLRRPWHRGHANLIRRFYEALGEGTSLPVTGEDGRAVVAVLDQMWEKRSSPHRSRAHGEEARWAFGKASS